MGLSEYKMAAAVAVCDMDRVREFYEGKLGLLVSIDSGDNLQYRCGEGSVSTSTSYRSTLVRRRRSWLAGASTTSRRL